MGLCLVILNTYANTLRDSMADIHLNNVSKRWGSFVGVEKFNLDIADKEFLVLLGPSGCGKTTQVPQFLYEAGYGDPDCLDHPGAVCVTQPRRVAVTSTAKRIAEELNVELGGDIGYQVRHDKRVGDTPVSYTHLTLPTNREV